MGGARLGSLDRVLVLWREREDRASRVRSAYSPDAFRRCKVHYLLKTLAVDRTGIIVWGRGPHRKGHRPGGAGTRRGPRRVCGARSPKDRNSGSMGHPLYPLPASMSTGNGFSVAAVGQEGARESIRQTLEKAGWTEITDFVAVRHNGVVNEWSRPTLLTMTSRIPRDLVGSVPGKRSCGGNLDSCDQVMTRNHG